MIHYRHLSQSERISIRTMRNHGRSIRQVARALGRSPSTVSRELRRNAFPCGDYNPHFAQRWALFRREDRPRKIRGYLESQVLKLLDESFSPEQIQMLLWSRQRTSLSHQTIYNYIWENYRHRGVLWKTLRYCGKGRHCRRYRRGPGTSRRVRRSMRCIDSRPDHVARRLRYGHWEMDLIEGVGRKRPLLVFLERKSRFVTAGFLTGKWAEDVVRVGRRLLRGLKVHTITSDNGPEFMNHELIEEAFNCPLYYAHSYASWQKGAVENVNGLLRQYFPKGTSFTMRSQSEARLACKHINSRPRKILNKRSPQSLLKHLSLNT